MILNHNSLLFFWRFSMKESDFQSRLKKKIKKRFPGCIILKNDPTCVQGIPDLLILYKDRWAALECKVKEDAAKSPRPNQPYYVNKMNEMSYASFVYPENEEEILNEVQRSFESRR